MQYYLNIHYTISNTNYTECLNTVSIDDIWRASSWSKNNIKILMSLKIVRVFKKIGKDSPQLKSNSSNVLYTFSISSNV